MVLDLGKKSIKTAKKENTTDVAIRQELAFNLNSNCFLLQLLQ